MVPVPVPVPVPTPGSPLARVPPRRAPLASAMLGAPPPAPRLPRGAPPATASVRTPLACGRLPARACARAPRPRPWAHGPARARTPFTPLPTPRPRGTRPPPGTRLRTRARPGPAPRPKPRPSRPGGPSRFRVSHGRCEPSSQRIQAGPARAAPRRAEAQGRVPALKGRVVLADVSHAGPALPRLLGEPGRWPEAAEHLDSFMSVVCTFAQ